MSRRPPRFTPTYTLVPDPPLFRSVLLSQPMASEADIDATIVFGVNQQSLSGTEQLVSNASCTTNCGVPLLKLLNDAVGLEYVSITTIHSAMNDQIGRAHV